MGVCGKIEEAGDINTKYDGSGISGARYAHAGLVGIDWGCRAQREHLVRAE